MLGGSSASGTFTGKSSLDHQRAPQNLKEDQQNQRREVDPPRRRHQLANRRQSRLGQHSDDANHLAARRELKPAEDHRDEDDDRVGVDQTGNQ